MIKIKEGVNYKEFYKYGFHRPESAKFLIKNVKLDRYWQHNIDYEIDLKTKIVTIYHFQGKFSPDSTLFDLMNAGLIEIVEE